MKQESHQPLACGSVKKESRKARLIILFNGLVGAVDVLVLFFLQAKLPAVGLNKLWLGQALFAMGIGAAAGAKATEVLSVRFQIISFRSGPMFF